MSAYIVDSVTIDRIVTYVEQVANEYRSLHTDIYHTAQATTPDELGQALYRMNVTAVDDRYRDHNPLPPYRHTNRFVSGVQVYKSMQCFLYQCSEGDVPDQPLFKALERLHNHCANSIIRHLPDYSKAVWG